MSSLLAPSSPARAFPSMSVRSRLGSALISPSSQNNEGFYRHYPRDSSRDKERYPRGSRLTRGKARCVEHPEPQVELCLIERLQRKVENARSCHLDVRASTHADRLGAWLESDLRYCG